MPSDSPLSWALYHEMVRPKKQLRVFPLTCRKILGSVGRKIFLFFFNYYLLKKDRKCSLGLNSINSTRKHTYNGV